ncbi:hypothetical protein [Candidatus Neptunochlamydia vexilliferae]|uniref:Uncharacterized protein n=1 Tax=Candidatus Neptunichlamydia vexilliferae TaxID=1651774 RepID=A0ABS0AWS3_9BACT|nr:hypothetical protein [Candidatus Neptunochlamydia vexilliferae]MBF5058580.1 hypothetical protein [Candidatus Neptunochlamydia vexilliferae]
MDWTQSFTIIGIFSVFFIYLISKTQKLTDKVNSFEKNVESRFGKIETRISVIENELKNSNQRLTSLENHLIPKKIVQFEDFDGKEAKEG